MNNDRKRVLILYADAGFGHRSAAIALAVALEETYGDACVVEMVNPLDDRRAPQMLRDTQTDYDRMVRRLPELYKLGYQASDASVTSTLVESGLIVLLFEVMRDVVKRYKPDVIVSTYPLYMAPLDAVFTLTRRTIPIVTVVTDLATVHRIWFNDRVELCLVPNAMVGELALDAGLHTRQIRMTGIPVHPDVVRETRPPEVIRRELGWRPDRTTILAVGGKRVENLFDVLRAFNHSGLNIQLVVTAGGDEGLYEELTHTEWHCDTHLYDFVTNMPTLMHAADLVISKAGGLIVTESLACGLPMILVGAIPGQEEGNAQYVIQGGAGELVGSPLAALETLFHWLDHGCEQLQRRAAAARSLGYPRAAYAAAELTWLAAQGGIHHLNRRKPGSRLRMRSLLERDV